MPKDAVLRSSLICLGVIVLLIGLYTYSFKKMIGTYIYGLFAIAGVLLPDWEFFDRDISQWTSPMPADNADANASQQRSKSQRFRIYPVRFVLYTTVYSFGLYKWWMFVSKDRNKIKLQAVLGGLMSPPSKGMTNYDSIRSYYETLLLEAKGKRAITISEDVEKSVCSKQQEIQLNIEKCIEEKKIVASINQSLLNSQDNWRKTAKEIEERERSSLALRDEKILDMEEQIRDLTVYIEAQRTLEKMSDSDSIKGGTVLPVPLQQSSSLNTKRRTKNNRRRS